jgi:hypothetical protein
MNINENPQTLSDNQLDAAIAWCAERNRVEVLTYRKERLRRAYMLAIDSRIKADPLLANTSTVQLS